MENKSKRRIQYVLAGAVFIGAASLLYVHLLIKDGTPSAVEFWYHQERYEAIVEHLAGLEMQEPWLLMQVNGEWSVENVEPYVLDPEICRRPDIIATRLADGRLLVSLVTMEWGHGGTFGYFYCSGPDPPELAPLHFAELHPTWSVDKPLAPNWWLVYHYMD